MEEKNFNNGQKIPNDSTVCSEETYTEIFIGGLPNNTKDEELRSVLSKYAEVKELKVKRRNNKSKNKCLGYAIAKVGQNQVQQLINLRYLTYKNRKISLTKNLKGKELEDFQKKFAKRRLFIKDLPKDAEAKFLETTFSKFGHLDSFYIRGQPGTELKLGVVIFQEKKSALAAFHYSMNNMIEELKNLSTKVEFDYRQVRKHKESEGSEKVKEEKKDENSEKKSSPVFDRKQMSSMNRSKIFKPKDKKEKNFKHWMKPGMKSFKYSDFSVGHYGENLVFTDGYNGRIEGVDMVYWC